MANVKTILAYDNNNKNNNSNINNAAMIFPHGDMNSCHTPEGVWLYYLEVT